MTNENISIADRLALKLRESEFGSLLDEADLTVIAKDAIDRAFFKNRQSGGYNSQPLPPLIVDMAREAFTKAMNDRAKALVDEMVKDEAFANAIRAAAIACIPDMLMNHGRAVTSQAALDGSRIALDMVMANMTSGFYKALTL